MSRRLGQVAIARVHTGDRQLDDMQRATRAVADELQRVADALPFMSGKAIRVRFTAITTRVIVRHGLGQPADCMLLALPQRPAGVLFGGYDFVVSNDQSGVNEDEELALEMLGSSTITMEPTFWFYPRVGLVIKAGATQAP